MSWRDAKSDGSWFSEDEMNEFDVAQCETVGWLVRDDVDVVVLADSREGDNFGGLTAIPRSWIVKLDELR